MDLLLAKPHSPCLRLLLPLLLRLLVRLLLSVSTFVLSVSQSVSPLSAFFSAFLRSFFDVLNFAVALKPKIEARGQAWGLRSYVGPWVLGRARSPARKSHVGPGSGFSGDFSGGLSGGLSP
jgi:hypothetical protein